jgi:glycosyltransferase involved in cell wall biosynthesis
MKEMHSHIMKVLLLNSFIPDYRLEIFNLLGQNMDLTVGHSGIYRKEKDLSFKQIIIPRSSIGPFWYYPTNLTKILDHFDLIISDYNIRAIDRNIFIYQQFRRFRWLVWGIGVSASRNKKYDEDKSLDKIRNFIFRRADAMIFYSDYPVHKHVKSGFNSNSLFVANNTTHVHFTESKVFVKRQLMFVGTLYKQKKIELLLSTYLLYVKQNNNPLKLVIIGSGPEHNKINRWISLNGLDHLIKLKGSIYNPAHLESEFRRSLVCISPAQAGLSVLNSMGHGTAFVTRKDAITGGERFNILNGDTGVLYEKDEELLDIINDVHRNPQKYIEIGNRARKYYLKQRNPEQMATSMIDACNFVFGKGKSNKIL